MKICLSSFAFVAAAAASVSAVDISKDFKEQSNKHDLLRGSSAMFDEGDPKPNNCNSITTKEACTQTINSDTNEKCVWCVAGAIPSECVSKEQSQALPAGVFNCEDDDNTIDYNDDEDTTAPSSFTKTFNFNVMVDTEYTLTESTLDTSEFCDESSKSISGYMDIKGSKYDEKGEDKHLFYWMFEKRPSDEEVTEEDTKDIPFMIWLNGGPGCSSSMGLLTENGPCTVNDDGKTTKKNPFSWTNAGHVLWLDQPAGVGYSYGSETDSNEQMVSEDVYYFLQAFMQSHPEYAQNPFFIFGESYAGHYVPAIAARIYQGNQKVVYNSGDNDGYEDTIKINLSGIAIGNGLTDPEEQYKWYPEMAYGKNSHNIKVIDESTYNTMKSAVPKCTALIHKCNSGDTTIDNFACQAAFEVCNLALTAPYQMTGLNPYDIRKKCDVPPLCYDFSKIEKFLNSEDTKKKLHVDDSHSNHWSSCNYGINMKFHTDWMKDFSPDIVTMLDDAKIPVLIYVGDVDFICNYLGNKAWTTKLKWSKGDEFSKAPDKEWNNKSGLIRNVDNFTFLQIYDAGHMVPTDQPKVSLDMVKTFVKNGGKF